MQFLLHAYIHVFLSTQNFIRITKCRSPRVYIRLVGSCWVGASTYFRSKVKK